MQQDKWMTMRRIQPHLDHCEGVVGERGDMMRIVQTTEIVSCCIQSGHPNSETGVVACKYHFEQGLIIHKNLRHA